MRIILVHSIADLYGASRSLLRLSSRLVKEGHKVLVILKENGPLVNCLTLENVNVEILSDLVCIDRKTFKSPRTLFKIFFRNWFSSSKKLESIVQGFEPDLIHTNTALILTSAYVSKKMKIPHIWHIRESFQEFGILWNIYRKIMIWRSDLILSVSTPISEQFTPNQRSKVKVLHNGFPKSEFECVTNERVDTFKRKWKIEDTINIGVVGRLKFVRKGQEVLIKAAAILRKYDNLKFLLIGDPFPGNENQLEALKELAKKYEVEEKVIFTGGVEDIKAAYLALDISVLTSCLPEPFGGVVIESMALGKPVVGTSIGGTTEQIEDNVTGFKIPPNNPEELAKKLEKLIVSEDLRLKFGQNGRKRFEQMFEFEKFYNTIIKIYKNSVK